MSTCLVLTTINPPSRQWQKIVQTSQQNDWQVVIVGDAKSPETLRIYGESYYDLNRQAKEFIEFSNLLPKNHYARKNLGYLIARARGARIIVETDDDNFPYDDKFFSARSSTITGRTLASYKSVWLNPYTYFTDEYCWPRGIPLEVIQETCEAYTTAEEVVRNVFVQQGLADKNPDVCAVFRLTRRLPVTFRSDAAPLIVPRGTGVPFNSQNTTIFEEAFPLLYLPSFVSFRMTDIWRSFVALRLMHEYGWNLAFMAATVYQDRNDHNLLKDFTGEIPGYLNNDRIWTDLQETSFSGGASNILSHIYSAYQTLVNSEIVPAEELKVLRSWLSEFDR